MDRARALGPALAAILAAAALTACASTPEGEAVGAPAAKQDGGGFLGLGGGDKDSNAPQIGVNSFLWRASLDTLSFMPLTQVDPTGGVIITDWANDPKVPNERFKATVYILDTRLRADGLKVNIFRQVQANGVWQDAQTNPDTAIQIENAILTRARQLRLSQIER